MSNLKVTEISWWQQVHEGGVLVKYGVKVTDLENQPWRLRDWRQTCGNRQRPN